MKIKVRLCNENPELDLLSAAYTCRGKNPEEKKFSKEIWIKWLLSEHTPVETIQICISFDEIEKPVVAQFVRHTDKHPRHFVQSSRPDLNGGKPRDPNALIKYTCFYNPQAFILMMRKRLCSTAEKKTRQIAFLLKKTLMKSSVPFLQALGEVSVPNCIYRYGCAEPWTKCNFSYAIFSEPEIETRYQKFNELFLKNYGDKNV